jgi:multiple sugar transport system permease protein
LAQGGQKLMKKKMPLMKGIKRYGVNYIGLLPYFTLFIIFVMWPMIQGIAMSFTDWAMRKGPINFVGLDNYKELILGTGRSPRYFRKSFINLFFYIIITIPVGLSLALSLALLADQFSKRLYTFFRRIFFIPTALPLFLAAGIWLWFMQADTGILSVALAKIGIGRGIAWNATRWYAIIMVAMVDVWHSVGFNFIILSAGIMNISGEYYEAAELDGATMFQKMRYITIPLLEPIIFLVTIYAFITALQVYDVPWIVQVARDTENMGGPGQVLLFPVMEMVRNVYSGNKSALGRATAEGVILMLIIIVITLIQFKHRRKTT